MIDHTKRPNTVTLEFTQEEARVIRYALHRLGYDVGGDLHEDYVYGATKLWEAFHSAHIGLDR